MFRAVTTLPLRKQTLPLLARDASNSAQQVYDVAIVGGGIVGLATARQVLLSHPNKKVVVLEKERELAMHQTGHNSGVIHTGVYYTPGSLKAKLCVEGADLAYKYCEEEGIPHKRCGKLIVAVDESEVPRLDALFERGKQNDVKDIRMIEGSEIKDIEPHCKGVKAIHCPYTGIVDWGLVARNYAKNVEQCGGVVLTNHEVNDFSYHQGAADSSLPEGSDTHVGVHCAEQESVLARRVITCAGAYSDRIAGKSGCDRNPRIVPFRGEYLILNQKRANLIKGNIYPVPDPRFPFLGVHFTPRMDGSVWLGPNAVLAFAREGYKLTDVNLKDVSEFIAFSGLRKLALRHLRFGMEEMYRGINIAAQVAILRRYIPDISVSDVTRGPTGVRAQALDEAGNLVDDFVFDSGAGQIGKHMLHVRNAPSPGATSSLAIAKMIVDKAETQWPSLLPTAAAAASSSSS
ncbi:L-2-hydroxyglutarate dehydrogenase, mitochondrial-like [Sycon ciliatum]|uniref:L-2-hydroxyglutarate dehydrogenase, mitochondrial-like n=1 Tax=Sycon ciliatum TaxID=27933 RepID=UPI0031F6BCA2